jgi:archaemetzincin
VIPLGIVDEVAVRVAAANIQAVFDIATDVAAPWPDPTEALFFNRSQYNAAKIIRHLAADIHGPVRRIGIISRDISLPFLTYVFGEAQIGGLAAVISTYRLQRPRNGVVPEKSLVYRRLSKITIHETGHLLGLSHCRSPQCIMNFSVGLDKLDVLDLTLCNQCVIGLKALLGSGCKSMDSEH